LKYLPGSLILIAIIESDLLFVCKINHEILILVCPAFGRVGLKSMEDKKQVYFIMRQILVARGCPHILDLRRLGFASPDLTLGSIKYLTLFSRMA